MKEEDNLVFLTITDMLDKLQWLKELDSMPISVEEKLARLVTAIECPLEFIELFKELIKVIKDRLRVILNKNIDVYGFGSFLTGLALKDSDLDLTIEYNSPLPQQQILGKVRKFLSGNSFNDVFKSIILIRAKVPILRCQHIIGFQCDISVGNKLSIYNSELIKLYLSMNKSYRTFFLIIKFWTKKMGLSAPHLMKSYTIVLLIIFYLQEKKLVPSVESLETSRPRIIDGWKTNFTDDLSLIHLDERNVAVITLLQDFFSFYSSFEFGFYIISPFLGKKLLKPFKNHIELFSGCSTNNSLLNDESFICVQDTFRHDFNPANSTPKECLLDFQTECKNAEEFCSAAVSGADFLERLFSPSKLIKVQKQKKKASALIMAPGKLPASGNTEDEICEHWMSECLAAVESLLIRVVLTDNVTRLDNSLLCRTSYCAFNRKLRTEIAKALPNIISSPLDHHIAISAQLKELPECKLTTPYNFQLKYQLSRSPTRLIFELGFDNSNIAVVADIQALQKSLLHWLTLIVT